jgi:hypothetical protein
MRPILVSDITSVARALLFVQPEQRQELVDDIFMEADFGDRYTRRFRRAHGKFGDGTLARAARKRDLADEPTFDDVEYCRCLELVVKTIVTRREALENLGAPKR